MFKVFYLFMILPILFCSQADVMVDLFSEASMVEIYRDGQILELSQEEQTKFEELFCSSLEGAVQMPAYGVSLDQLTKEDMKNGIWVKFIFERTQVKSEMPFDELLIKITTEEYGLNIIRGNSGIYEGRCYYLNLKGNLNDLYNFLSEIQGKGEMDIEVELESQEIKPTMIVEENEEENDNSNSSQSKGEAYPIEAKGDNQIGEEDESSDDNIALSKSQKELLEHLI